MFSRRGQPCSFAKGNKTEEDLIYHLYQTRKPSKESVFIPSSSLLTHFMNTGFHVANGSVKTGTGLGRTVQNRVSFKQTGWGASSD